MPNIWLGVHGPLVSPSNTRLAALINRQTRFAVLAIIDLKDAPGEAPCSGYERRCNWKACADTKFAIKSHLSLDLRRCRFDAPFQGECDHDSITLNLSVLAPSKWGDGSVGDFFGDRPTCRGSGARANS
jgi:hypothetical protein